MTAPYVLACGRSFNGYELDHVLGEGGMGSVWKAQQLALHRPVAIKFLKPEYARDPHLRQRFLREGEAAARVRGPHVVEVFDVGTVDGELPYLVMEFLDGEDLRHLLHRLGALPVEGLVDLMLPVCAAIHAAHSCGVIHRDLKPENIHLSRNRDGALVPKVVDFGISRVAAPAKVGLSTGDSAIIGTPGYIAPEQARGAADVDASVDQYALGVILYEGLVGAHPYEHDDPMVLLVRAIEGDLVPPRARRPELPAGLDAVVVRAMARTPAERFASVRELGRALFPYASPRTQTIFAPTFGDATTPSARPAGTLPYAPNLSAPPSSHAPPSPDEPARRDAPRAPVPEVTQDAPGRVDDAPAPAAPMRDPARPLPRRRTHRRTYLLALAGAASIALILHLLRGVSPRAPRAVSAPAAPAPAQPTPRPAPPPTIVDAPVATPPADAASNGLPIAAAPRPTVPRRPRLVPPRGAPAVVRTPGGTVVE